MSFIPETVFEISQMNIRKSQRFCLSPYKKREMIKIIRIFGMFYFS